MGTPLVIAEVVPDRWRRQLRRYRRGDARDCPLPAGYHNAIIDVGEVTDRADAAGDNWPHDDPRWPKTCACGYEFVNCDCGQPRCIVEDYWQRNDTRIVRLPDGTEFTWWGAFGTVAPPGTMIRAEWYDEFSQHPAGVESWLISLPGGGEWFTSQKATDGGYWDVTGTPPLITVSPSIWFNSPAGWHGHIVNGELVP